MSKLDELIKELCPNGVEYKNFGEIATIIRGASPRPIKNFITTNKEGVNWIKIGDVKPGEKYITETAEKITIEGAKKSREVKIGDFILSNSMSFGRPYILKVNGCIHDGWLSISDFENSFITDFLYHLLNSKVCQYELKKKASFGGAVQNLNAEIVRSLVLPVPPLEVQHEIVRILDSFTLLTAELTAELTARKKQYEYYRDELLLRDKSISLRTIDSLCKVSAGGDAPRDFMSKVKTDEYTIPIISNGIGENALYGYTNEAKIDKPSVTVAARGTVGYTEYRDYPYVPIIRLLSLIPNNTEELDTKFLYYCLQGKEYTVPATGIPQLTVPMIKQVEIPLPNIDIQRRIVSVLDNFEKICNDLNIGLPAEIEARKKQYEYYRDVLLTFAETGSTILTDRQTDRQELSWFSMCLAM